MKVIAVGSDPEFFIQTKEGTIVPSRGIIPGTKTKPRPLIWGAVHRDNVLCELNPLPAKSEEEFSYNFFRLKKEVEEKFLDKKNLSLVTKTSHVFDPSMLNYREAQEFGCSGDSSIWDREQPPIDPFTCLRSAGGHIHIAIEDMRQSDVVAVISNLDLLVSVPLVQLDTDKFRRTMYGRAGCFRIKPYGIEYRTPSNAWCSTDELRRWVFRQVTTAVEAPVLVLGPASKFVRECIDNSDVANSEYLCQLFSLEVPV